MLHGDVFYLIQIRSYTCQCLLVFFLVAQLGDFLLRVELFFIFLAHLGDLMQTIYNKIKARWDYFQRHIFSLLAYIHSAFSG